MNTKYPTIKNQCCYPIKKVVHQLIDLPQEYVLIEKVGQGSFGEIFKIYNIHTHTLHACKVETRTQQQPLLQKEYKVFKALQGIAQIPQPYQFLQQNDYNMMIMPFYGFGNLEELRKKQHRYRFSESTVLKIAHQMINVLEQVHERKYVHRDIKPENFLVGSLGDHHTVYLIDYGLAKQYIVEGQHIPMAENKGMVGTARYTSINSHVGLEQGRRDDLEAVCYVLLYLYLGNLPWQNINCSTRQEKFQRILDQKSKFSANQLEVDIPAQLRKIYDYSRSLKFDQTPDYRLLKSLCGNIQNCFDWCPSDCKVKPFDEQDINSELSGQKIYQEQSTVPTTKKFEKIDEECDEDSIAEYPQKVYVSLTRH